MGYGGTIPRWMISYLVINRLSCL